MAPSTRLVGAVIVLVGVFLTGVIGFVLIEHVPLFDAIYFTAITLSTVGFGETIPLSPAGRVWTLVVIFLGITTVSTAFTSLVAMVVRGEIRSLVGSRKVQSSIARLHDHIILCGFGRMGSLASADLAELGHPLVVIENNPNRRQELSDSGHLFIIGDATEEDVLQAAGLTCAKALVTMLPHDVDNVFVTLTAHSLRPELLIIARAEQPNAESKLKRAGAARVICPQSIGAGKITTILTRPHVVDFFEVAAKGVDLEMDGYTLSERSPLCGDSIGRAQLRSRADAMVVAIRRPDGQTVYNPAPETTLHAHDTLVVIGPRGVSMRLDQLGPRAE